MKLYLATSNKGKVREIKELFSHFEVIAYSDVIKPFEIVEDAPDFKGNAILKAEAVFKAIGDEDAIVIADDSGISVEALDNAPGIFSARFAGNDATDGTNNQKLVDSLKAKGVENSNAFYTAAIALTTKEGTVTTHGWMHGTVSIYPKGTKGFGYDPLFTPLGYNHTLGELDNDIKFRLSHRSQALHRMEKVIEGMHLGV